jgi:hypothetical protein
MGLEIRLVKYDNFKKAVKLERDYSFHKAELLVTKSHWPNSKELVEKLLLEYINKRPLLNEDGKYSNKIFLDEKQKSKFKDFKFGYFSSTGKDGLDNYLGKKMGVTLWSIFEKKDTELYFRPNWKKARVRINRALLDIAIRQRNYKQDKNKIFGKKMFEELKPYQEKLKIVEKTILFVLAQKDKSKYYIHWII